MHTEEEKTGHTPGPWRWEVHRAGKNVKLCGGDPKGGDYRAMMAEVFPPTPSQEAGDA